MAPPPKIGALPILTTMILGQLGTPLVATLKQKYFFDADDGEQG